ncbi:unnamed protein product [Prorocentrum cordatum]|uniref:Hexosyltransferase n=1 Tax=Prorocentrum cordatum TaxID=2364126 RepID=A0ABN9Q5M3_9DINO|nr:unnamed protein product [Polarella glacialis]
MGSMKWVLQEGIQSKPDWYQGVTETSRFEQVQKRLHGDKDLDSDCDMPCTPKVWQTPSLFCWSLYRSDGYEVDLVKTHVDKMVGIFACDEFLPLCDEVLDLGNGITTTSIGKTAPSGVSKDGTAANTLVFMTAWAAVHDDFRYHAHDWILKVDPDAVLLPHRMRPLLAQYPSTVYIKNCNMYDGPGWPMMFGSLEAISRPALQLYYDNADRCREELEWEAWGEDLWLGNCLDMLGAESVGNFDIIGDGVCTGANCGDGLKATYHPFKSSEDWFNCTVADNTAMPPPAPPADDGGGDGGADDGGDDPGTGTATPVETTPAAGTATAGTMAARAPPETPAQRWRARAGHCRCHASLHLSRRRPPAVSRFSSPCRLGTAHADQYFVSLLPAGALG